MNIKRFKKKVRQYWPLMIMALPGIIYLFINNYLPMGGLVVAFKDYNFRKGIWGSDFIGFRNFQFLFQTKDAFVITRNTILYNAGFIFLNTIFPIAVAIALNEVRKKLALRIYQTVILLPYLISMIIVSYLVYAFLSTDQGFLNKGLLEPLGLGTVAWYSEAKYWPFILNIVSLWKGFGFYTIIYFSAILGIDSSYYESAKLDGAGETALIRHITIPLITPIILTMVLLAIGRIFYSDFGLFYRVPMDSGILYGVTNVIDTYVYRGLIKLGDIGMSAAAGLYQAVVGFILVLVTNLIVRHKSPDNALF